MYVSFFFIAPTPFPTTYVVAGGVGAVWVAVSIAAIVYLVYGWKRVKKPNSRRAPLTANTVPQTSPETESLSAPLLGSDNTEHQQASDTPYREYKERNVRSVKIISLILVTVGSISNRLLLTFGTKHF